MDSSFRKPPLFFHVSLKADGTSLIITLAVNADLAQLVEQLIRNE